MAHQKASEILSEKQPGLTLAVADDHTGNLGPGLTVYQTIPTNFSAYLFGIEGLYNRLKAKKRTPAGGAANALVVSALAYLRQIVGIGGFWEYGELNHCIDCQIEMYAENEQDTQDEQESPSAHQSEGEVQENSAFYKEQFSLLVTKGRIIGRLLGSKGELAQFAARYDALLALTPTTVRKDGIGVRAHKKMLAVSNLLLDLYRDYPTRHHYDSFTPYFQGNEEYFIGPDSRIGFVWNETDWMSEAVMDNLNMEFNSEAGIAEPLVCHHFSQPLPDGKLDGDFEKRLFSALDQLYTLL